MDRTGHVRALEHDFFDFGNLLIGQAGEDVAPLRKWGAGSGLEFVGIVRHGHDLNDDLLILFELLTQDMFERLPLAAVDVPDIAADGFNGGIVPQFRIAKNSIFINLSRLVIGFWR